MTGRKLKNNERVEIRPLTREDFAAFYGMGKVDFSLRGVAFYYDGELSGVGGIRYGNGVFLAFSDIKDDIEVSKATVYRCGLEVMKVIKKANVPVYAVCGNIMTAPRFLKRLGFKFSHTEEDMEVYVYG